MRTQDQSGCSETSALMEDLVKDVPGFLGMDRAAQKRGQAEWYQSYTLHVAKVERSHGFTRA